MRAVHLAFQDTWNRAERQVLFLNMCNKHVGVVGQMEYCYKAMQIFFLDESGTPPSPGKLRDRYFVIGGLAIPDGVWHKVRDLVHGMKVRRKLVGELKWRYFTERNKDDLNPMREMSQQQRNEIRAELYGIICGIKSIRSIACVACIEAAYQMVSCASSEDLYHYTYKPVSERFQYHLQDLTRAVAVWRRESLLQIIEGQSLTRAFG